MQALPPPTDRGCLIAWNAPANAANRQRLAGIRLLTGLSLRSGVVHGGPTVRRLADGRVTKLYRR